MSSVVMNSFKRKIQGGSISLSATPIFCALVTSGIATCSDIEDFDYWSQLSAYEVTGTGYTANGKILSGSSIVEYDAGNYSYWDANDPVWAASTITSRGAVLYTSGTEDLICFIDFGDNKTSSNGNFTVQFASNGILRLN